MKKYNDMAALNDVKTYVMGLSGSRLEHEAFQTYNLDRRDYDTEMDLKLAMLAIEERNYWK